MLFEFSVHPSFNFLASFAKKLGVPLLENRLLIPEALGKGYVKKIDIQPDLTFVMHSYILNQDFHLKRMKSVEENDLISIIFNSTEIPSNAASEKLKAIQFLKRNGSAIQIAPSSLATESFFPANSLVHFGVVGISRKQLSSLLQLTSPNATITTIMGGGTFFYHENMSQDVQRHLRQLSEINDRNELDMLYYRIKVLELLYAFFGKLLQREPSHHSPINNADLEKLYSLRTMILTDFRIPPRLQDLSKAVGMSETKMKQLFKQIFGDSIYNYYQKHRMSEAAFLLKQAGYSVSEVGYQLCFTNLSHFSRIFASHFGKTPKKFSLV